MDYRSQIELGIESENNSVDILGFYWKEEVIDNFGTQYSEFSVGICVEQLRKERGTHNSKVK